MLDLVGAFDAKDDDRSFGIHAGSKRARVEWQKEIIGFVTGAFWRDFDIADALLQKGRNLFDGFDAFFWIFTVDWDEASRADEWTGNWEMEVLWFGDGEHWATEGRDHRHLVKVGDVVVDVEDLMVFWKLISASDLDVDLKGAHDDIVGLADDGVIEEVRLFWCAILRKELAPDNEENNPQGEEDVITDHPERKDQEPEPNVKE